MKAILLLLEITSVAFALSPPRAILGFDTKKNLVKRVEEPGKEQTGLRPRPVLDNVQTLGKSDNEPSIQDFAITEPKYPYQDKPIAQEQASKDGPAVGKTIYIDSIESIPAWAKIFLGLSDEEYAKAMASDGWLKAGLDGRKYTVNPEESRTRQRAIGLKEYNDIMGVTGVKPMDSKRWNEQVGWWQGRAVEFVDNAAMRRNKLVLDMRKKVLKLPAGARLQFVDNTGTGEASGPALKRRGVESQQPPNGIPPSPVNGGPLGHTLLEDPYPVQNYKGSKLLKRQNPVNQITNQETGSTTNVANNTNDLSAEYQTYLAAYRAAQSNASDLIFPFLDTMLNGTNSSIVYNAAWSIYSDLTGSSPVIVGPFTFGMHSLDWIEDQIFGVNPNITAMSDEDKFARNKILAFHSVLLDLYYYAWNGALAALNETGLLDDMTRLAGYLSTNDTSVMGGYANYKSPAYDTSYFTIYNATVLPDSAYGKLTS